MRRWDVHYLRCDQIQPPKDKFVVLVHTGADYALALLVNTRVSPMFRGREDVAPCFVPINAGGHAFLAYDSIVDCTRTVTFPAASLTSATRRGSVSSMVREAVLEGVGACRLMRTSHKALILSD